MLISGSHHIGQAIYHLECPKYRYKMFRKAKNKKLCEEIAKVAERHGLKIIELNVMQRIHAIVSIRSYEPIKSLPVAERSFIP